MNKKLCIVCGEPLDKNEVDFHEECEHEAFFRGIINADQIMNGYKKTHKNYIDNKKKRGRNDE